MVLGFRLYKRIGVIFISYNSSLAIIFLSHYLLEIPTKVFIDVII